MNVPRFVDVTMSLAGCLFDQSVGKRPPAVLNPSIIWRRLREGGGVAIAHLWPWFNSAVKDRAFCSLRRPRVTAFQASQPAS